jgi:uncharacterized protein YgiM (DUF1202 family)
VKSLPKSWLIKFRFNAASVVLCAAALVSLAACKHSGGKVLEVAYVSGVQVNLRDRVAPVYEKAGYVKNGDRVEVLDHDRRFAKVRTSSGQLGWMEQRYLVSQQVFERLQKLIADNANDPVQAQAVTRNDTNLHVEPGRDTEHLYQILSGEKLTLLKRGTAPKPGVVVPVKAIASSEKAADKTTDKPAENGDKKEAVPALEDWWLVRDSHGRVGWVLGRMVDVDVPLDIAEYAEGQRIVAFFVLNQVQDDDKKVPQYLTVMTEPKDGLPFDFNQFRVFTWNVRRHRYETAYREHVEGVLPVVVGQEDFSKEGAGKEGMLPVFTVQVLDENGATAARKYKLNTPIVRRVYAPGGEPSHPSKQKKQETSAKKTRRSRKKR